MSIFMLFLKFYIKYYILIDYGFDIMKLYMILYV